MDAVLADPSASRAVLIGVHTYRWLDDLPAVQRNLKRLKEIFTNGELWGLPPDHCEIVDQPGNGSEVMDAVVNAAANAQDTLLVYYAGHGLTSQHKFDELHLALPDARPERLYAALQYDWIRRHLLDAAARRKIVILDCCYSGRALSGAMGSTGYLADRAAIEGTAILAAAAETAQALAPEGEEFTAFTGELIKALDKGIEDGPELLAVDTLYLHLLKVLKAAGRPEPQQRNRNMGGSVAIARNRAFAGPLKGTVIDWNPFDLGVHPAINIGHGESSKDVPKLPQYIIRQHDLDLDDFLASRRGNTMAVLVGNSSTGKTRAAYEAVIRNFPDRQLLPITGADHLVDCVIEGRLARPSVIWLDETQLFVTGAGVETTWRILERILLAKAGGPVAIIGTMRPEFWQQLMRQPSPEENDIYYWARIIARGSVGYFAVPDTLATASTPNDPRLIAATRAAGTTGRVVQALGGTPFIIERYLNPIDKGGQFEKAILTAAIDARRLGHLAPLPVALLADAAIAYLDGSDVAEAPHDWFETSLRGAATSTYGVSALKLYSEGPGAYRSNEYLLNDYLEQYGRSSRAVTPVPSTTWSALTTHAVDPDDCIRIAKEAGRQGLYEYAIPLAARAADTGDTAAWRELNSLLERSEFAPQAEQWWHRAVDAGDTTAIQRLADLLERTRRYSEAEQWWHRAVDAGDTTAIQRLADLLQRTDRGSEAEQWWRRAGRISEIRVMLRAAERLYSAGHEHEAEILWNRAAEAGNIQAMMRLAEFLRRTDHLSESELWLRRAADTGNDPAIGQLAQLLEHLGRLNEADQWRRRTAIEPQSKGGVEKLFIGNIPYDTTNEDLGEFFAQYGEVISAAIIYDRATGRSKGFGFVEMPAYAAEIALSQRDQARFGERKLTVSKARPNPEAI